MPRAATAILACVLGAGCAGLPQDVEPPDFDKVEIEVTRVAPHLHVLRGTYANMLVSIGEDGVLLVDDDLAPLADKIKAAIAALGGGGAPRFVLNTHWHPDHTHGNEVFGAEGSTIIAHANVRKRLSTPQAMLGQVVEPLARAGWPILTFERSVSVHFNGDEIEIVHYPNGHTDGDAVIWFTGSNVVHLGDLFFEGFFPNVDLAAGGDVEGYIRNVGAVLERVPDDATIVPGHGPVCTPAELRRFRDMMRECTDMVRAAIDAGESREAIQAGGVPERWAHLETRFVTTPYWLGLIYDSLTRNGAIGTTGTP